MQGIYNFSPEKNNFHMEQCVTTIQITYNYSRCIIR
jgi:hypothetical protein